MCPSPRPSISFIPNTVFENMAAVTVLILVFAHRILHVDKQLQQMVACWLGSKDTAVDMAVENIEKCTCGYR